MAQQAAQTGPVYIMKDGSQSTNGRDAQYYNIMAAMAVAGAVVSTLGPKGMDKMLVDSTGDIVVTNDGVTILRKMDIEHPAAKMIVEVAKTQDAQVGDGTTTAVVLAGELLKQAGVLLERNVHPAVIVKGYGMAARKALELVDGMAIKVTEKDRATLLKIADTSITGKDCENAKEFLSDLVVKASGYMLEKDSLGNYEVEKKNLVLEKKTGSDVTESRIIEGVLIDKGVVNFRMPKKLDNAKVLAMEYGFDQKDTKFDAEYKVKSNVGFQAFRDEEDRQVREQVEKIAKLGVTAVFTTQAINDLAQHYMAKYGIMGVRRLKRSDVDRVAKASGGEIVMNIDDISPEDIGTVGHIEEIQVGDDKMLSLTKCKDKRVVSVILRAPTTHILDEYERGIDDALHAVQNSIKDGKVVPGGAAVETELSLRLKQYAATVKGKEQLSINAFAEALEIIPKALAMNAGLNSIDAMIELKKKHGDKGGKNFGLNVYTGKSVDMVKAGVVEPLRIKTQAIQSAVEAVQMIMRIDDVLAATQVRPPAQGGAPGGYGM
ncbi:thermosome [Methanocella paludicola SANAE]|uniref:Thermosome n=1 Tax=Methanocella paludicola (strain DSM 17711 / JCM 13418 / NBRC 101707 / SANAE) TaxID=304371 RepID=D1Z107_METPS|nr:thermosome subunit alpha [Methanocella paludicola]BAI62379.1 thermosome [Methanocella paludicola SANAE]